MGLKPIMVLKRRPAPNQVRSRLFTATGAPPGASQPRYESLRKATLGHARPLDLDLHLAPCRFAVLAGKLRALAHGCIACTEGIARAHLGAGTVGRSGVPRAVRHRITARLRALGVNACVDLRGILADALTLGRCRCGNERCEGGARHHYSYPSHDFSVVDTTLLARMMNISFRAVSRPCRLNKIDFGDCKGSSVVRYATLNCRVCITSWEPLLDHARRFTGPLMKFFLHLTTAWSIPSPTALPPLKQAWRMT